MVEVYWVRPPSRVAVPYDNWVDDALCSKEDSRLFELGDQQGITTEDQLDLIAQGLKICSGCPVRASCLLNSSELDRYWTTRGGQPPKGLSPEAKPPSYKILRQKNGFTPGLGPPRVRKKKCKRGHEDWITRPDGKRRCKVCRKLDNQKAEEKRKQNTVKALKARGIMSS